MVVPVFVGAARSRVGAAVCHGVQRRERLQGWVILNSR